jgi:hypothetical protein
VSAVRFGPNVAADEVSVRRRRRETSSRDVAGEVSVSCSKMTDSRKAGILVSIFSRQKRSVFSRQKRSGFFGPQKDFSRQKKISFSAKNEADFFRAKKFSFSEALNV